MLPARAMSSRDDPLRVDERAAADLRAAALQSNLPFPEIRRRFGAAHDLGRIVVGVRDRAACSTANRWINAGRVARSLRVPDCQRSRQD